MLSRAKSPSELLQDAEIAYKTLLDNSFDAVISIDSEGLVTTWNHRAESMFGWTAEEAIGVPLTQTIIPSSYHEAHVQGLKRFVTTKKSRVLNQQLELTAIHRKGYEFPIEICICAGLFRGKYIFTGIIKDISKHKDSLRQMQLQEEEYKVLHAVAQSLQGSETMEGMLQSAMEAISQSKELHVENKAGVFIADKEKKVLHLTSTLGTFPEGFLETLTEVPFHNIPYGRCYTSGEMVINDYCQFKPHRLGPFGDITTYGTYIIPLKSRTEVVGVLFLYTPETPPCFEGSQEILLSIGTLLGNAIKHRQFEKKIHQQNEKLNELNTLKNKFLGVASHDLRNPLYAVLSYSHLLEDGSLGELNDQQSKILQKIGKSGDYMCSLLDNLLDISKIESGQFSIKKSAQNINSIVKDQVEKNQLLADEKNIQLHFESGASPSLRVDESAMIQVMDNLIGNAVKFSPKSSRIDIQTETSGHHFRFSVKDEGPGISREDQKLAFGEFQTLGSKPTGGEKSTGLGLSISKKLIELHGGKVGVLSQEGQGSTFYFELPLERIANSEDRLE